MGALQWGVSFVLVPLNHPLKTVIFMVLPTIRCVDQWYPLSPGAQQAGLTSFQGSLYTPNK